MFHQTSWTKNLLEINIYLNPGHSCIGFCFKIRIQLQLPLPLLEHGRYATLSSTSSTMWGVGVATTMAWSFGWLQLGLSWPWKCRVWFWLHLWQQGMMYVVLTAPSSDVDVGPEVRRVFTAIHLAGVRKFFASLQFPEHSPGEPTYSLASSWRPNNMGHSIVLVEDTHGCLGCFRWQCWRPTNRWLREVGER